MLIAMLAAGAFAEESPATSIDQQLQQAAQLFADRQYEQAAQIYQSLLGTENFEQASWALELYGVCLEKQGDFAAAEAAYLRWLEEYADSAGEVRVKQRLLALQTAAVEPRALGRTTGSGLARTQFYGSASLMYRGLTREVDGGDRETAISSISGDMDLHFRAGDGDWFWRGRANGGYMSDHSDGDASDGRVANLYLGIGHEPSGTELLLGRKRNSDTGVYGYLDGASLEVPLSERISINALAGQLSTSSRESSDSDRFVYAMGVEYQAPNSGLRARFYAAQQEYDGLTERQAIGGEFTWFNDWTRHFVVLDYDTKFQELNNALYSGNFDLTDSTNIALSLGYQRSPFLSASNAIIGVYDVELKDYLEREGDGRDIYDAALEKTAINSYLSAVINQELRGGHRVVGELYHFELSDLPEYDFSPDAPDSDANTTLGLQYIWPSALFDGDSLSMGVRYTDGDTSDSTSIYFHEKLYLDSGVNMTLRLRATQRRLSEYDRDSLTLRPAVRLDWYISRDLLLESELGYEWWSQDFGRDDYEVQQLFIILGLRKRF